MYSIELPNRETLKSERENLVQILKILPEHQKNKFTDNIAVIHEKFSEGLNKIQEIANTLEQLDTNAIQCEDLSTSEKVLEFRDICVSKIKQFEEIEKVIDELLKISVSIYELTNVLMYLPPNQKEFSTQIIKRFEDFQRAITEDLPELKKIVTEQIKPYIKLERDLVFNRMRQIQRRSQPDDGVSGMRIIGEREIEPVYAVTDIPDEVMKEQLTRLKQMHEQEKKFSPRFRRFLRAVGGVIAAVALWFPGSTMQITQADISTPTPSATASASPYASPSSSAKPSPSAKIDFSRMPASQFAEIATLPTGQVITQNKNGQMITMNNIDKNKWVGSDGNEYISFKYPFGTKNFFNPVRKPSTAGAKPTASPAASASPSESPSSSPSPSASESPEIPFDYSKEPAGTLKSYGKTGDGMTTAIGADGDGAYLREVREFGPGVFRSIGGKLYNKKISQGTIIFVPR